MLYYWLAKILGYPPDRSGLQEVIALPQRRTARKDLRKQAKHIAHNLDIKTDLRKVIKKLLTEVKAKKVDDAKATLKLVFKKLDKACKRNIIHKNTVGRRKSLLSKAVFAISK